MDSGNAGRTVKSIESNATSPTRKAVKACNHGAHGEHGENLMEGLVLCSDELSNKVIDAAFEVHRNLGPGLLESVYERAMAVELRSRSIDFEQQAEISVPYKGENLGIGFRPDLIIENCLVVELKAVEILGRVHTAQLINYLKLLKFKTGYLLNFNVPMLKTGIKRISI